MMQFRRLVALTVLWLCFVAIASAFTVSARVSRTTVAIADSVSIAVELNDIPANAILTGPWQTGWRHPFVLLESGPVQAENAVARWSGIFAVVDTGNLAVPSFELLAVTGSDTQRAKTLPIPMEIRPTIRLQAGQGVDTLMAPNRPPKKIPPSVWEWLLWLGGPLALVAAGWGLHRYNAYRKSLLPPLPPPPPPPPESVALERLAQIREEAKWQLGDIKGFSSDLTDVLKEYLEHRFIPLAREMTTTELRDLSIACRLGENEHGLFVSLLSVSDEIKFAKGDMAAIRCLEAIQQAEHLVGTWGIKWRQEQEVARAAEMHPTDGSIPSQLLSELNLSESGQPSVPSESHSEQETATPRDYAVQREDWK